jgi:hypothetical protein
MEKFLEVKICEKSIIFLIRIKIKFDNFPACFPAFHSSLKVTFPSYVI